MVSMGIFSVISVVILTLLVTQQTSASKAVSNADATTYSVVLFEKFRQELRGAKVVGNPSPQRLETWRYAVSSGSPSFGSDGRLKFVTDDGDIPIVAVIAVEPGRVVRRFPGDSRSIALTGEAGEIELKWLPAIQCVDVSGKVGTRHETHNSLTALRPVHFRLALLNVE